MRIVVASKNPVKLNAARLGFERMFPDSFLEVEGVSVPSGVGDQPMSDGEAYQGAWNRAKAASEALPDADYWVGLEGGVETHGDHLMTANWIVVKGKDGVCGKGRTDSFALPPRVAELIRQGKELGEADDIVFGRTNSKQANGAIGLLTGDVIDRCELYVGAVVCALIPFKNPDLFKTQGIE